MGQKTSQLDELQNEATKEIIGFFKGSKATKESRDAKFAVNMATRALGAVGRLKATERARDATQEAVLKAIAENQEQYREFVGETMPHLVPKKLLSRPKKS